MEPFYHPRLKDHEVAYAIRLRHIHDRIKSGILLMAGASTLYWQNAMPEDAYRHHLSKAEAAYRDASQALRELEPPASLARLHRHYLEGFADYQSALTQLGKLVGCLDRQRDHQWLAAVADLMRMGTRKIKRVTLNLWLDEYITEHGEELDHQAAKIEEDIGLSGGASDPKPPRGPRHRPHQPHGEPAHDAEGPHV